MRTNREQTAGSYNRNRTSGTVYVHGSAAPKYASAPQRRTDREYGKPASRRTEPKAKPAPSPVNLPVLVLTIFAACAIFFLMLQYIRLNSEISEISSGITSLESQINTLSISNDEYYGRIMSSVDLEEVREVAIMDLGMVYATKDQIITYESQTDDYLELSRVIQSE